MYRRLAFGIAFILVLAILFSYRYFGQEMLGGVSASSLSTVEEPSASIRDAVLRNGKGLPAEEPNHDEEYVPEREVPYVIPAEGRKIFEETMAGSHDSTRPIPIYELYDLAKAHPEAWADLLARFLDASLDDVSLKEGRWIAVKILGNAIPLIEDDITRARWVRRLALQAEVDSSGAVVGSAIRLLLAFPPTDFNEGSRVVLRRLAYVDPPIRGIPRLIGILGIEDLRRRLEDLAGPPGPQSLRQRTAQNYEARLGLARMGNKAYLAEFLDAHAQEQDPYHRVTRRLGDLAFTRQAEAIEQIRETLFSDDRLPPVGKDSDIMQTDEVAKHALGHLARMELPGFPFPPLIPEFNSRYSDSDIARARTWMRRDENWRR